MRTKEELKKEIKKVIEEIEKSKEYWMRNSNKGYLKGLLFAFGFDSGSRGSLNEIITKCGLIFNFKDKIKVEKRVEEILN